MPKKVTNQHISTSTFARMYGGRRQNSQIINFIDKDGNQRRRVIHHINDRPEPHLFNLMDRLHKQKVQLEESKQLNN